MLTVSAIPRYRQIADLYAAAGVRRAPVAESFDVLTLTANRTPRPESHAIGPHRRGFFQLTYLFSAHDHNDLLLAAAPEQVLNRVDYLRPGFAGQQGFTLLFQADRLQPQLASPTNEFPFFCQPTSVELPVGLEGRRNLLPQFRKLAAVVDEPAPYRAQRWAALTIALLYEVRAVFEQAEAVVGEQRLCAQLACRFDEVVLQHFQTHHTVEDYAKLLHVSADHLSAEVKAKTGRNAREIIAERLMTEARHLLTYTELQVAQIADRLGFSEPTHFTRFFKRYANEGPAEFRRRALARPTDRVSRVGMKERRPELVAGG